MGFSVGVNPPKTPVTKGSRGRAKNTLPNVCKMPGPPAPFVPSPLPNIGKSELSPKGYSTTVKMEGQAVAIRGATFESFGDMASKGTGGGLISANTHGPTKFITPGSVNVKIEGKSVHQLGEPMLNNCGPSGSPPNTGATMAGVAQDNVSFSPECEEAVEAARQYAHQQRRTRPQGRASVTSAIRTPGGQLIAGRNGPLGTSDVVREVRTLANSIRDRYAPTNSFNCSCAEMNALANAVRQGIPLTALRGSVIGTVNVRVRGTREAREHGKKKGACDVCSIVLIELGIREC